MQSKDKNRPSPEWIADLRKRFPVEREIDRVLTRKLERRAGPGYTPLPLPLLVKGVESLIRTQLQSPFEVSEARWLSGGASKLQMAFTLDWDRPGEGRISTPMVLRMEPAESIVETSRLREFQLIRGIPGPCPCAASVLVRCGGPAFALSRADLRIRGGRDRSRRLRTVG